MSVAFRTISTLVAACAVLGGAPAQAGFAIRLPLDAAAVQRKQNADPRCQR